MANKKLSYNDIAEKGLFDPLKKEIKEVDKALEETAKSLKEVIKQSKALANSNPLESYENMKDAEKAIEDTGKAVEKLDKIEKERKKLQEQLLQLEDDRIKKNFELREEINQQRKALREAAKEAKTNRSAYQTLTKQVNEAQKQFKDLATEFGANSKEAAEARKEFDKLDKQLREVNEAARDGRRDVGRYRIAVEKLNKGLNTTKGVLAGAGLLVIFEKLVDIFKSNEEGADSFAVVLGTVTATLSIFVRNLVTAFKESDSLLDVFSNLKKEFQDFDQQIANVVSGITKAVEIERELSRETVRVTNEITELRKEQAGLEIEADNVGISLTRQLKATKQLIGVTEEILLKEQELSKERIAAAKARLSATPKSIALQQELADTIREAAETEIQSINELTALRRQAAGFELDIAEQNLDILLDVSDRRKTIAERIAADEKENLNARQEALLNAEKDLSSSLEAQLVEIQKFTDKRLDLNKLLAIESSEQLNEELKTLDLNERAQNRLREVIIERIAAVQDLKEAQNDLSEAELNAAMLQKDVILLQEAYNKSILEESDLQILLADLEEERLKQNIKNLETQLLQSKSNSVEELNLEKELLESKLELQQFYNEKEIEEERKKQEQIQEITEAGFEVLNALNQKRSEDRIENLDEQLDAARERESELKELAERGSTDAEQSLAALQQRQAELALQREQEIQRQQTFELALAAIQTYTAKVQAGENPAQAIASTLTDISLLQSLVQALPAFFEGTEDTGKAFNALDSEGGRLAVLHDNERVMTKKQNALIPKGMSNMELAILANQSQFLNDRQPIDGYQTEILSELKGMKKAIIEKKEYLGTDYNRMKGFITDIYRKQNRTVKEHHKIGRAFR